MAITRVNATTASNFEQGVNKATFTPTFPAATAGNVLFAVVGIDKNSGTITPPAGWTVLVNRPATSISTLVLGKVAAGGETDFTVTWATANSGAVAVVAEYTGVDTSDPFDVEHLPAYSNSDTYQVTLDLPTTTTDGLPVAVFTRDSYGVAAGDFEPAATGWTSVGVAGLPGTSGAPEAGCPGAAMLQADAAVGSGVDPAAVTFSWATADQVQGYMVLLNDSGAVAPTPTVVSRVSGGITDTSAVVKVKTTDATNVRLVVDTDPDLDVAPAYSSTVAVDAQSMAELTVSGLAADTAYHYGIEADGTLLASGRGQFATFPTAGAAASFGFVFGSCRRTTSNTGVYARMGARAPLFVLNHGDLHYEDINSTDPDLYRTVYDTILAQSNVAALFAQAPLVYTWGDHDYTGNGSHSGAVGRDTARQVYRERIPHYPTPTAGIEQTFVVGRCRFILWDSRSWRSPGTSMLGATQKQWTKDTILAATEPLIFIVSADTWVPGGIQDDHWGDFPAEQAELVDWAAANGIGPERLIFLCGDAHAIYGDDGTNSPGGFQAWGAASWDQTPSSKGGPYSEGIYPGEGQYGHVVVTDDGTTITATFNGYDATETSLVTLTQTVSTAHTASGGSASTVPVTSAGAGEKASTGGSSAALTVTSVGAGFKRATGGSPSPMPITTSGGGTNPGGPVSGGSSSTVAITTTGGGTKVARYGTHLTVTTTTTGSGMKRSSGGSVSAVTIAAVTTAAVTPLPAVLTLVGAGPSLTLTPRVTALLLQEVGL